jgi:RHH-type transcriptional regulator, rel operon repressor / antitoxin RelB
MKSDVMTVRLAPAINKKLDELARNTNRSKAYLAGEAIKSYVEHNAWQVARIKKALEEVRSGASGIPHAEIVNWMNSWRTDHELPPPEPPKT